MAGFGRAVRREQIVANAAAESRGESGRGSGDEAIHQHGAAIRRGAQTQPAQRVDFESAQPGQQIEGFPNVIHVQRQRALDSRALARHAGIVGAGAAADHRGRRKAGERGGQGAGHGGVGDAHFSHAEQRAAF